MRIAILVDRRYLAQTMPSAVLEPLAQRGARVEVLCVEDCYFDPESGRATSVRGANVTLGDFDAVLARTRHSLGLAMLAYAEMHDLLTINSAAATERVRNKAHMAIALHRAGLRTAPTMLACDPAHLAGLPRERYPLILKPTFGDNSRGLVLARTPDDLTDLEWREDLVLAQEYLPNDGFDLKLYVCGNAVFAVRKPSPFNGDPLAAPRVVAATRPMVDLARRCGSCFGLEIYGVDTIETAGGLVVIEVNEFPNFSGLASAADCIADHIVDRIETHQQEHEHAHRAAFAAVAV